MLRALKDLFSSLTDAAAGQGGADDRTLQLATAVLLVEVMRADPAITDAERQAVVAALRRKFALHDDELARLLELAQDRSRGASDFFSFTSALNDRFDHPQKIRMVEFMWQVAYADGHLHANESHLISKVAGLLHVTHGEYIAAKLHARDGSGR
ncbi:MAG: TerB family tellurite resistance protein [Ramlibacter sp.]|jgi:uncharacterized tellurite resistance protein B-like protein|uniref:tellurite resistance TerB family protein n=1 Tax=Ramlibacter sp. TaxID=1917967 RepID=UPI002614C7D3|nr:TerB family tellurite resistance protein [Ramlibacter sp.]MDB5752630.1 TerB family tellurite resistance protein [Ramlibacter sp.]